MRAHLFQGASSGQDRSAPHLAFSGVLEPVLGAALLGATYMAFDIGWRDSTKAALIFWLGACALLAVPRLAGLRCVLEVAWRLGFAGDLLLRSFLMAVYRTNPDAALVLDAVGNTSAAESMEFVRHHAVELTLHLAAAGSAAFLLVWLWRRRRPVSSHPVAGLMCAALFLGVHANATARAANPFLYWPGQAGHYVEYQAGIRMLAFKRASTAGKLDALGVTYTGPARNTVAFVIGESINRNNWSLYGYARPTSPQLDARQGHLVVFKDVLSASSNTVGAFRHMLTARDLGNSLDDDAEPSVTLLAKEVGYKTFWISNQHDRYINNRFAQEADVTFLPNSGGRRSDRSLDERLLPAWEAALSDPAPKKLIIVHLLGAHPHYDQRRPAEFKAFNGVADSVTAQMRKIGRLPWIVAQRNEYDNALLYHDHVVSSLLDGFMRKKAGQTSAFLYTSDHGQDVGHTRNHAGHAENLPGYAVPMLLWTPEAVSTSTRADLSARSYQSDVLDWTLLDLLDIGVRDEQPWNSVISPSYRARERGTGLPEIAAPG